MGARANRRVDQPIAASLVGFVISVSAVSALSGCTVPHREAKPPSHDGAWIAVLSGEMPGVFNDIARHSWIVGSIPGEAEYVRWELDDYVFRTTTKEPYDYFGRGDISIHAILRADDATILRKAQCLDGEVERYAREHPNYFPAPGPNSNTFVAEALRNCEIRAELPTTAVGRHYLGMAGASVTENGTGVQVTSPIVGARIGLREGVEVHLGAMAVGVHAWPPGIIVPANPGRLGFDDDLHVAKDERMRGSHAREPERAISFRVPGTLAARMLARAATVRRPADAGGLAHHFTVGLSARGGPLDGPLTFGFGLDFEVGVGIPAGFSYSGHVYPAGILVSLGRTSFVGAFGGLGTSGVTARVPAAFEVPIEARAEIAVGSEMRMVFRGATTWTFNTPERRGGSILPFGDEATFGTLVRFGKTRANEGHPGFWGRGRFFGLERRELMGTYWLGLTFGSEFDFGPS